MRLRSPIAGRVIERRVDLGAPVGGDQQEKEIYVVADLSSVWVELRRLGAGPCVAESGR
jgi:cobalt-zinc-cadmium efflux system membrane fusion protein